MVPFRKDWSVARDSGGQAGREEKVPDEQNCGSRFSSLCPDGFGRGGRRCAGIAAGSPARASAASRASAPSYHALSPPAAGRRSAEPAGTASGCRHHAGAGAERGYRAAAHRPGPTAFARSGIAADPLSPTRRWLSAGIEPAGYGKPADALGAWCNGEGAVAAGRAGDLAAAHRPWRKSVNPRVVHAAECECPRWDLRMAAARLTLPTPASSKRAPSGPGANRARR
jgi:hypothetical protein